VEELRSIGTTVTSGLSLFSQPARWDALINGLTKKRSAEKVVFFIYPKPESWLIPIDQGCNDCGRREYAAGGIHYLCPECSRSNNRAIASQGCPQVLYDYNSIRQRNTARDLFKSLQSKEFLSLLPLKSLDSILP
jgi:hypothetical protein